MRFKGGIEAPYGNVDHIDEVGAKRSALAEYLGISSDDEITESDIRYLKALQEKVSEIVRGGYDISHSYVLIHFLNDSLSGTGLSREKFEEYKQAASSIVDMRSFDWDWYCQENFRRREEHFKKICEESHNDDYDNCFDFEKEKKELIDMLGFNENDDSFGKSR